MKNSLCVTTFIFGEKYQSYLPILLYSLLKAYPEYYPIIYLQNRLTPQTETILTEIGHDLGKYQIIQDYYSNYQIRHKQKGEAIRWILDYKRISDFDYCYFVDADMFYIREPIPLLTQHQTHCSLLKLPYSNLVRKRKFNPWKLGNLKKRYQQLNILEFIKIGFNTKRDLYKMSGLHFIETKEYYKSFNPIIEKYKNYIFGNKSFQHHTEGFNDECFLYDMIKESGIGLPPIVEDYGPHLLDYRRFNEIGFRPHHGIHLGIFRNENALENYKNTLMMDFYLDYYNAYKEMRDNDDLFKYILNKSPKFIKDHFELLDLFYKKNLETAD